MEQEQQELAVIEKPKQKRGFATMNPELRSAICSKGGKTAHAKGKAHEFTSEEGRAAGKKGGFIVSRNSEHMSSIARIARSRKGERPI